MTGTGHWAGPRQDDGEGWRPGTGTCGEGGTGTRRL